MFKNLPCRIGLAVAVIACGICPVHGDDSVTTKNEVVVMGMIHSGHSRSGPYDIDHLKQILRKVKPDYVLTEIPPDRLATATKQFKETGKISEMRVRVFPEYTDALFPLTKEMKFEIIPCAAWSTQMNDSRRATMAKLKTTHAEAYKEMQSAQRAKTTQIAKMGDRNDPRVIHTDRYDAFVKTGMEPYDRHFNKAIGAGGWSNINASHYANIAAALDQRKGEGKRFLVTFGSWHKYYIKEQLRKRDDVTLVSLQDFLPADIRSPNASDAPQLLADFAKQWDEARWEKVFRGSTYMRTTGDSGWKHRMTALRSLILLGEKSVPALTKALDSEHEPTRILAAQALGYLGPHADIERVKNSLKSDKSAAVRLYAADVIGMSGKSKTVDWSELSTTERNRDVLKHMSYAKQRQANAISGDVIATLRKWNPQSMDSAKVGEMAPDFRLQTIEGDEIALSDYRGKQPVVLVFIYGDT